MLRITPIESGNEKVVLRLEGRVCGPWVTELGEACQKVLNLRKTLVLNLAEVTFLDGDGIGLLMGMKTRGVELAEASMFVTEQLKSLHRVAADVRRRSIPEL